MHPTIAASFPDVDSVVVMQRGDLLFEHYKPGTDANTLHDVQSVTKSVLALLVGIALERGALKSLDQAVATLLPTAALQDADTTYPPVTIRHLLTMTAGFEPAGRFSRADADNPQFLMQRPRRAAPGTTFEYDNLAANLLSIALEAATGQATSSFAREGLFEPMGITAFEWARGRHRHTVGFSGLSLRTRDMARLGQLVLQQGAWQGRQLLPREFTAAAVQPHNAGGPPAGLAYGYLWWVGPASSPKRTFLASGYGGQFIWVYPPMDLVVATTSAVSETSQSRAQALTLIRNDIFRAVTAAVGPSR
ncbi:serine hydrolase domain-containing protein [Aquabacterium sp.]|uniref:serine hydrolase domain-containing protein n=1 Tax=Aquabacterium sp. TaxID=1872578 RepID=UPI002CD49A78|nr:serine hydrolase [Aquabacterium sp.]HSW06663.1 serine hydrolase [Aquabacterium sp.]